MTASDGLTLGTALAQLKDLKREFDALELAAGKARHQLDRILEQFDLEDFDRPICDDNGQDAAQHVVALTTDFNGKDAAVYPADTAATTIEQTFSDDVDSLFDAELIVDDVLGGRKFDEIDLAPTESLVSMSWTLSRRNPARISKLRSMTRRSRLSLTAMVRSPQRRMMQARQLSPALQIAKSVSNAPTAKMTQIS